MKIENIFSDFLAIENLNINNELLESFCIDKMENDAGRRVSNRLGWQSNDLDITDENIKPLIKVINDKSIELYQHFEFNKNNTIELDNIWININKKYSFNSVHNHPGALFSGVYYVKCSLHSGSINMINPNVSHRYVIDEGMIDRYNYFNSSNWYYKPNPGDLIIFPGWLSHEVEPNLDDEDRISIAFNINYK